MNKVRFLSKIAIAASIFAAFTVSCSDDSSDPTWCTTGSGATLVCYEVGKSVEGAGKITVEACEAYKKNASGETYDKKPADCNEDNTITD
jgi:hypothetical protein